MKLINKKQLQEAIDELNKTGGGPFYQLNKPRTPPQAANLNSELCRRHPDNVGGKLELPPPAARIDLCSSSSIRDGMKSFSNWRWAS